MVHAASAISEAAEHCILFSAAMRPSMMADRAMTKADCSTRNPLSDAPAAVSTCPTAVMSSEMTSRTVAVRQRCGRLTKMKAAAATCTQHEAKRAAWQPAAEAVGGMKKSDARATGDTNCVRAAASVGFAQPATSLEHDFRTADGRTSPYGSRCRQRLNADWESVKR
jgi:hypothetical protein